MAARTLGHRLSPGLASALPWLQETDAAIETQGLSRWHNYYVEGLNWLMRNTGLDGLYLDGIGYDREIMKRVAKVMIRNNPAARINYHSGDNWSPPWDADRLVSPANATEFFSQPYVEREQYVQFVGNSRGTISDCRGLGEPGWNGNWQYQASTGAGYWEGEVSITWAELGIASPGPGHVLGFNVCRDQQVPAQALSCWSPVSGPFHDRSQFGRLALAAAGTPPDATPTAAPQPVQARLIVDWPALGLDPAQVKLTAPPIAWFQEAREFKVAEPIPVEPGKGWLLLARQR